jgi:hypothetical protein
MSELAIISTILGIVAGAIAILEKVFGIWPIRFIDNVDLLLLFVGVRTSKV